MIRNLLPPVDIYFMEYYYQECKQSDGFDPTNTLVRSKDYYTQEIDIYNRESKQGSTARQGL